MMKSYMAKPETVERKWYVVDATGMSLGRLASQVASVLRGKNKPTFTPHVDAGDYVIVINTDQVVLTGKKTVAKEILSSFRLCRPPERNQLQNADGGKVRLRGIPRGQGHASEKQFGQRNVEKTACVQG